MSIELLGQQASLTRKDGYVMSVLRGYLPLEHHIETKRLQRMNSLTTILFQG